MKRSDIILDYFISVNKFNDLMEIGCQSNRTSMLEGDMKALKMAITDQIEDKISKQFFVMEDENFIPVGFVKEPNRVHLYWVNCQTMQAACQIVKLSEFYMYLSLTYNEIENNRDI